jgi:hypothetical protein
MDEIYYAVGYDDGFKASIGIRAQVEHAGDLRDWKSEGH